MLSTQIKWLREVISPEQVGELAAFREIKVTRVPSSSTCLLCKGGRMLCGKLRCPIIAKAQSLARSSLRITSPRIQGSTPPGVFVGRIGYPKVYIGPMVPPFRGDTEILDTPELWLGKGIQDIIDYRFALIRGKARASVYDAQSGSRLLDLLQELALGKRPVDAEAVLTRVPRKVLTLSGETQPFGPSAPLRSFTASEVSVDHRIEGAFYDRDLKAADAVVGLYDDGVLVTRIQRAFSLGMFGTGKRRKLVPTRWSITAVDSILSQELIDRVKQHDTIDEYRVYSFTYLDNRFAAILMPESWSFEWIEAWFPGTTWNPDKRAATPAMMGDFEPYRGRTTYPDVGGCYYACRLAVAEQLNQERRQASALVLREIHPGYILPLGVWGVREGVRAALRTEPQKFDNLQAALNHAMTKLTIPLKKWIENSELLKRALFQKKLTEFTA
ncbi:MAG: Nre family DNA repair protein [Candidatus Hodarchaeaceae archaeon]|nr:Nre family DNA repair protein [Candidatus Hodarchaeaceae archaeon]